MAVLPPLRAAARAIAITCAVATSAAAQQPDYHRAEQSLTWNQLRYVFGDYVEPHWTRDGAHFWYRVTTPHGAEFIKVDASALTPRRSLLFENARLAAALSRAADSAYDAASLPFREFRFARDGSDEQHIEFDVGRHRFTCDITAYACTVADTTPSCVPYVRSPDGKWEAFVASHNVYIRATGTRDSIALTSDGADLHGYGLGAIMPSEIRAKAPRRPMLQWSPDSKRIAVPQLDQRRVLQMPLISMTPSRPVLYTYPYALPGDSIIPTFDIHILDVAAKTNVRVQVPPQNAEDNGLTRMMDSTWVPVKWGDGSDRLWFTYGDRGPRHVRLYVADAASGRATELLADSSRTYVELNTSTSDPPNWAVVNKGSEILWFSERDGWGHLYLYGGDGKLKNQVTSGPWTVGDIVSVDAVGRYVYFTGRGREPGNPYYARLYRAKLDGGAPELLTPEDGEHHIAMLPSGKFYVDAWSRIDVPPVTMLRSVDGKVALPLEKADISALRATGWHPAESFTVKGRDGVTDIWGVMFKPTNFDSTKSYPVIDNIYPGPQVSSTPYDFVPMSRPGLDFPKIGQIQALADLGFIVVETAGMGTNLRSKAFHDTYFGNMGDNSLPDHITAIQQLAARHRWIDANRVGIYGHSGGGFASTDGLLRYPNFYKVAVSISGNHDNRTYYYGWAERYQGLLVRDTVRKTDNYAPAANQEMAGNLRGHLFLIHGDLDDNVHPAHTIQMVNALIKANKSFDLLIVPDRNHDTSNETYVYRRTWDYFVEHLAGAQPPRDYQITTAPKNP